MAKKVKPVVSAESLEHAIATIKALPHRKNSKEWWKAVDETASNFAAKPPNEFWQAANECLLGKRPAPPKSKAECLKRVEQLVEAGRTGKLYPLAVSMKGTRGNDAACGETLEHLLGVGGEGGNAKNADGKLESKFHGGKTDVTLLHSTPKLTDRVGNFLTQAVHKGKGKEKHVVEEQIGGNGMWEKYLPLYGYRRTKRKKDGEWALQRSFLTVPPKVHFAHRKGNLLVLPNPDVKGDYGLGWSASTLNQEFIYKLKETVIVIGTVSEATNTVKFTGAIRASVLREPVLGLITQSPQVIVVEPDVHLQQNSRPPKGPRDRGTKFRISKYDLHKLWENLWDLDDTCKWIRRTPPSSGAETE